MLFHVAVINLSVNNCEKKNPPLEEKNAIRHHARRAVMQAAKSLRGGQPCSRTHHCISQMPPTAKSKHNFPSVLHPCEPLTQPTKLRRNEQYRHFTESRRKRDFNRSQLQRRLDTEILLCAVNKRPPLSRRPALMWCYEAECKGSGREEGIHSLGIHLTLLSRVTYNE